MAEGEESGKRVSRLRWFALGCLAGVAGVWAICAIGLRVNGTDRKERGYLAAGPGPAGTCAVIKEIAAVGGDRVTIGAEGVRVNGLLLKNSAPRPADDAGR
jgi:type IV secretory pathway protease TraF